MEVTPTVLTSTPCIKVLAPVKVTVDRGHLVSNGND